MTQVRPSPFLTQPWQAGITGWIVVFGGSLLELVAGIVTNSMSMATADSGVGSDSGRVRGLSGGGALPRSSVVALPHARSMSAGVKGAAHDDVQPAQYRLPGSPGP